jgi:hypothetical protein
MWKQHVQEVYESLEELESYDNTCGIAERLGYSDAESLWEDNPVIQGSTDPKDFKVVDELTRSQLRRQDFVDNQIHWLLTHLAEDINGEHMWAIEDIAKVREVCQEIIFQNGYGSRNPLKNNERDFPNREDFDMEFYPYLIEDEIDGDHTTCVCCCDVITWEQYGKNMGLCEECKENER